MTYLKSLFFCCILFHSINALSQQKDYNNTVSPVDSSSKLHISTINITGNKKTKLYIILRELPFKAGDSLIAGTLVSTLEQARRQVYNLNLFSQVTFTPSIISANEISLTITVREKWFLYPTPQFQLVDRNFNDWLKTYHADFDRVVYGLKFSHYNFSGRGDQLRIYLLNGYARNISFSYSSPANKKSFISGFRMTAGYTENREISIRTLSNNKLQQFKKTGFVRTNLYASLSYQSRKGFFKRNFYTLSYSYVNLNDSVITSRYNPHYFNKDRSWMNIVDLAYSFSYSNTNNINYPLEGKSYGFTVLKRGLGLSGGINMLSLSAASNWYLPHTRNWYSAVQLYSKIALPFKQPYINQRALGYQDIYLRGLEYYVIDGVAVALAKYTLKKKLLGFKIKVPFHIKAIPEIPFTFFAKGYTDAGYAYIQKQFDTRLNNRFLYTGGFGLDILSLYDSNVSLEYSFNQLGEYGLFLHAKLGL